MDLYAPALYIIPKTTLLHQIQFHGIKFAKNSFLYFAK